MSIAAAYNERCVAIGQTGSGKSELLNVMQAGLKCQTAVFDSKDEFAVPNVLAAGDVDEIDWSQPIVHFVPGEDVRADAQAFFTAAFARRHLTVIVHEASDLCEYNANGTPPAVNRYIRQGLRHGLGLFAGTQRLVNIPKSCLTEAQHFYLFVPVLSDVELRTIAAEMKIAPDDLAALMGQVHADLGEHAFVHWSRRTRQLTPCPPLPEKVRARVKVRRTTVA